MYVGILKLTVVVGGKIALYLDDKGTVKLNGKAITVKGSAGTVSGKKVKKIGPELNGHSVVLRVNPDIAWALKEDESAVLRDPKTALGKEITIRPDAHLHHEQFDLMAVG